MAYLWRAVDAEGEVLDVLVQSKRNKHAALKLMRKLLKKYAFVPERLVTDDLRSYGAAARALGLERLHERGRWLATSCELSGSCLFRCQHLHAGRNREHVADFAARSTFRERRDARPVPNVNRDCDKHDVNHPGRVCLDS